MIANFLGLRDVSFTASDGRQIEGKSVYISFEEQGVKGMACDKVFVGDGIPFPANITPNAKVDISYNRKGKVEKIALLPLIAKPQAGM